MLGKQDLDKLLSKVARIYFNTAMPDKGRQEKDFLLERVEKEGNYFVLHLLTYKKEVNEFPPDLEDNIKMVLSSENVPINPKERLRVRKVARNEFIRKAYEWEAILDRKFWHDVSDMSNIQQYTVDLLALAKDMRASDVHIFPDPADRISGLIMFRIDGKLREISRCASNNLRSLLEHLHSLNLEKTLQDHKETRILEGGFYIGKDIETKYRLSSMQLTTGFSTKDGLGEGIKKKSYSLVIRLLKTENIELSLDSLGYLSSDIKKIEDLIKERSGFILVTGVTGMGKTTTIGSIVNKIAEQCRGEKKVITFEDPIEYHLKGALQFAVTMNEDTEKLTYQLALENCLRQDPDVIVVGEARNSKTVEHMVDAAQTGHLILATMHSKDTISALTRLVGYSIKGPAMNDSLLGVISQILIRKNCPQCRKERELTNEEVDYFFRPPIENSGEYEKLKKDISNIMVAEGTGEYQGGVCTKCEGLKYHGRLPLVQIYIHSTKHAQVISDICNGDPNGPTRMMDLFKNGTHEPFALNALCNLFYQYTSPREIIENLNPSWFRDYSPLLIKKANELIQEQKNKMKKKEDEAA